ncbi:MAG: glycosyltransferase [Deltaproteobacteria bacterium]|nr:glycosyltransferase [Deltaproteobacteria bacterium]
MRDELLKNALKYPRFAGPPKILVLDTGYFVVRDVLEAAADLGWEAVALRTKAEGMAKGGFVADLLKALVLHRPDFVLTMNHLGFDEKGLLAGLLGRYEVPLASWFVDHPMPILGGANANATPYCQVFCFERTALPWLERQGYTAPAYLPTGSNRRHFHPSAVDHAACRELRWPLTFAGNSWWLKAREGSPSWVRKLARDFRCRFEVNRHALTNGFEDHLTEFSSIPDRSRYAVAQVALAEASMLTRKRFAKALMPEGLRVFGDEHWRRLVPGVDLRRFVSYGGMLSALFAGSAVNANVTAEQMPSAVNQRVWDVPASGGFLLTDAQGDVLELFEDGVDVAVYRDFTELTDKARHYLKHPAEREAIAGAGFEKVDREHRVTHRLERMREVMRQRFA